jgi:hypothetical protein
VTVPARGSSSRCASRTLGGRAKARYEQRFQFGGTSHDGSRVQDLPTQVGETQVEHPVVGDLGEHGVDGRPVAPLRALQRRCDGP